MVGVDTAAVNAHWDSCEFAKNPAMHFLLRRFAPIIGTTQPPQARHSIASDNQEFLSTDAPGTR
jgi:hypothetical protein